MAFSPTVAWNTAFLGTPAGSDDPRQGDDRIRELKTALDERLVRELFWGLHGGSSAGQEGNLRAGAGRVYHQSSAPTTKPDGNSLDADDVGRMYVQSNTTPLYVRTSNSTWVQVEPQRIHAQSGESLVFKVYSKAVVGAGSTNITITETKANIRGIFGYCTVSGVSITISENGSNLIAITFSGTTTGTVYIVVFSVP